VTSIDHAVPAAIDMDKLQEFVFRAVGEVVAETPFNLVFEARP
jgi:hypothetical protein